MRVGAPSGALSLRCASCQAWMSN
ncbi:hypothetical protein ACF07Y_45905 [Streptomyces sp. NPDC016566]